MWPVLRNRVRRGSVSRARWREAGAGLETLLPLQARILASAGRLVKPGGRLVYATCSLLAEENEAQVERFLAAHPGFRVVPVGVAVQGEHLSLTPAQHGTDGFFAVALERDRQPSFQRNI